MKIYLVGMPLSGKTTVGKELADRLLFDFIDLDDFIEDLYEVNIDEMLKNGHEDLFRSLETEALIECLKMSNTVISTGGGIVLDENNNDLMDGIVVFLNVELEVLKEREKEAKKRPLLKDDNSLEAMFNERIDLYYDFADIILSETDLNKVVSEIIEILEAEEFIWKV